MKFCRCTVQHQNGRQMYEEYLSPRIPAVTKCCHRHKNHPGAATRGRHVWAASLCQLLANMHSRALLLRKHLSPQHSAPCVAGTMQSHTIHGKLPASGSGLLCNPGAAKGNILRLLAMLVFGAEAGWYQASCMPEVTPALLCAQELGLPDSLVVRQGIPLPVCW